MSRIPLLLDTDIGTDIDDAYALLYAAAGADFDLRAVTVVNGEVGLRARVANRLLRLMGRGDVPVHSGHALSMTPGEHRGWLGHEGKGLTFEREDARIASVDAAGAIADCASGGGLTICTIGAMTNLAAAILEYPEQTARIERVVAMAADYAGTGAECVRFEHNVACDPVAADIVIRSGIPVTLVGLNVTARTAMTSVHVDIIEQIGGPLGADLAGMHRVWLEMIGGDRSPMHDGLALASVADRSLLELIPVTATVQTSGPISGAVVFGPAPEDGPPDCLAATSVSDRFDAWFPEQIRAIVRGARE